MDFLKNIKSFNYENVLLKENDYTLINIDNNIISYKNTEKSNNDILSDLLECKAFATALLYLNENYVLEIGKFKDIFTESEITVEDYYSKCNNLLNENIQIADEIGIPLTEINGYKIFEGAGYILRGNGNKKIKESFKEEIPVEETELEEEGTQTSDIAPKVDQNMNKNVTTSKKKHYDILLSGLDEGLNILNKGFLRNSKGQYQRGNYILVKEGEKYLAIHKDKLNIK